MSKIVDRATEVQIGGRRKSTEPMRAYLNRLKAPREILDLVESSKLAPRAKLEARRLFIVCVCAAFETFWRDTVRALVKRIGVSDTLRRTLAKQSFSLADVSEVFGRKLTLAELVACAYTFQHTDAVNRALSEVLGIDAFAEFKKAKFAIVEVPRANQKRGTQLFRSEVTGEFALKRTPEIARCFAVRHETVHHVGYRYRPTSRETRTLENAVWTLNSFLGIHLEGRVAAMKRRSNISSSGRA